MTTTSSTRIAARSGDLLHGLALLNTNWEHGRSFIDNFRPFVEDSCRCIASPFTAEDVRDHVQRTWDIEMPSRVVTNVLRRLVTDKLVETTGHRRDERKYAATDRLRSTTSLKSKSQTVHREHEALLDSLIVFAGTRAQPLSLEEAETLLVDFLQVYAIPVLQGSVQGDRLPTFDGSLVAEFVLELNDRRPAEMAYLLSLVKGNIIRSALYLDDFSKIEQKFRNTTAYLDTPLVLEALGVAGPVLQAAALEELELAQSLGVRLACFKITVTEMRNVIISAAGQRRSGRAAVDSTSRVVMMGSSQLELLGVTLENRLAQLGVTIEDRPDFVETDATIEADIRAALARRIAYRNENAQEHDIRAAVAIHRLRRGRSTERIEDSRAIFLTTNTTLVAAVREAAPPADRVAAPLVIVDHEFAALLWLKKPMAGPDLPRRQVIADCFAALNPPEEAWAEYLRQLEQLRRGDVIDEATYLAARDGYEAQRLVTVMTRGTTTSIPPSLGIDVVEALKKELTQEERERAAEERVELEQRFKLDLTQIAQETATESDGRVNQALLDGERKAAQAREAGERAGYAAANRAFAELTGRTGGWIVRTFLLFVALAGAATVAYRILNPDNAVIGSLPFLAGALIFFVVQGIDSIFGVPVKAVLDRLGDKVATQLADAVERRLNG